MLVYLRRVIGPEEASMITIVDLEFLSSSSKVQAYDFEIEYVIVFHGDAS